MVSRNAKKSCGHGSKRDEAKSTRLLEVLADPATGEQSRILFNPSTEELPTPILRFPAKTTQTGRTPRVGPHASTISKVGG